MRNPCHKCEERHTLCWSKCEKHKAWKAEREVIKNNAEYDRLKMENIWKGAK